MNFCVRCGSKQVYQEYLCHPCYGHIHPTLRKEKRKKKETGKSVQKRASAAQRGEYFEATVQLRNVDKNVIDFVLERLSEHGVVVAKEEWYKHGVDFYVSDSGFAQKMGRELQQRFGGMVKKTAKIFTRDHMTGKDVYRVTVLFKQFPYEVGGEFPFKGKNYVVLAVGKDVFVEDAAGKEKRRLRFSELEKGRVF